MPAMYTQIAAMAEILFESNELKSLDISSPDIWSSSLNTLGLGGNVIEFQVRLC